MISENEIMKKTLTELCDYYTKFLKDHVDSEYDPEAMFGYVLVNFTASIMFSIAYKFPEKDKDRIIKTLMETFSIDLKNMIDGLRNNWEKKYERQN